MDQDNIKKSFDVLGIRFETVIKNLQEGILVEDENRKILVINQLFLDMFG